MSGLVIRSSAVVVLPLPAAPLIILNPGLSSPSNCNCSRVASIFLDKTRIMTPRVSLTYISRPDSNLREVGGALPMIGTSYSGTMTMSSLRLQYQPAGDRALPQAVEGCVGILEGKLLDVALDVPALCMDQHGRDI